MKLTDSEISVIQLLAKEGALRFTELLKKSDLSPGGLNKVLQNLQKKGLIEREQKTDEYPPPVIYRLSPKGKEVFREVSYQRVSETYMALMEFDPKEAKKLLDELKKKLEELKK